MALEKGRKRKRESACYWFPLASPYMCSCTKDICYKTRGTNSVKETLAPIRTVLGVCTFDIETHEGGQDLSNEQYAQACNKLGPGGFRPALFA